MSPICLFVYGRSRTILYWSDRGMTMSHVTPSRTWRVVWVLLVRRQPVRWGGPTSAPFPTGRFTVCASRTRNSKNDHSLHPPCSRRGRCKHWSRYVPNCGIKDRALSSSPSGRRCSTWLGSHSRARTCSTPPPSELTARHSTTRHHHNSFFPPSPSLPP